MMAVEQGQGLSCVGEKSIETILEKKKACQMSRAVPTRKWRGNFLGIGPLLSPLYYCILVYSIHCQANLTSSFFLLT
jgi:hypothetical protein